MILFPVLFHFRFKWRPRLTPHILLTQKVKLLMLTQFIVSSSILRNSIPFRFDFCSKVSHHSFQCRIFYRNNFLSVSVMVKVEAPSNLAQCFFSCGISIQEEIAILSIQQASLLQNAQLELRK